MFHIFCLLLSCFYLVSTLDKLPIKSLNCGLSFNKSLPSTDIFLYLPGAVDYFDPVYQEDAICYAMNTSKGVFPSLAERNLRILYPARESGFDQMSRYRKFNYLKNMFSKDGLNIAGIIGPDLRSDLEMLQMATEALEVNMVSYGQQFSKKSCFVDLISSKNRIFDVASTRNGTVLMYRELFKHYEWSRIAIIYQSDISFLRRTAENLEQELIRNDFDTQSVHLDSSTSDPDINFYVRSLGPSGSDYNVFALFLDWDLAKKVICRFHQLSIASFGSNYVLFGQMFWGTYQWDMGLFEPKDTNNCSFENYQAVLNHSLFIAPSGVRADNDVTDVEITSEEFNLTMGEKTVFNELPFSLAHFYDTGFISDAIWFLLRAVDDVHLAGKFTGERYTKPFHSELRERIMNGKSFNGMSGSIEFKNQDYRSHIDTYHVYQQIDNKMILAAKSDKMHKISENYISFRKNKRSIPKTVKTVDIESVDLVLIIPSAIGTIFCVFSTLVFVLCRKKPGIQLLSPKVNVVCGLGCLITFCSVIGHVVHNRNRTVPMSTDPGNQVSIPCVAYFSAYQSGYCLAFTCLVAKQYRIHRIFSVLKKSKIPSDAFLIVACILFSLLFMGTAAVLSFLGKTSYELVPYGKLLYSDVISADLKYYTICSKPKNHVFCVLYSADTVLWLLLAYFSWTTRDIKIALLNDSQKASSLIVISLTLSLIQALMIYLFEPQLVGMSSFFLRTANTILVLWVIMLQTFLPGLIRLAKDPNWKPRTSTMPPNLEYQREVRKCVDDVSRLEDLDQVFQVFAKTHEMWKDIRQRELNREKGKIQEVFDCSRERTISY